MSQLAGRSALVTGGGSGIGRAIALDLAEAGVTVTVCGRRLSPLEETVAIIESRAGRARGATVDLTDPADIQRFATPLAEAGGVDILINNAGFSSKVRSARYIGAEEWRDVMDVNTMGPAVLTRLLLEPMIQRRLGDVVMISSMAAIRPGVMAGVAYSAAKTAAKAYMDVLSQEVKAFGIRCLTVFPGEVDTPILDNRALPPGRAARQLMMQPEDVSSAVIMALSLPRRATVSDIAITASVPRDLSADIEAAAQKRSTHG